MKHPLSCLICFFLLSGYHIKKLLLASDILHFSVFGYRMQHSISCLIVRNRTNWSDRKGSAEKWSACICTSLGFWVACGDSIKKEWATICCLHDQFWSNFLYFNDLSGTRTQIMATEDEDLSASVIFMGIFSGMVAFFD